jgi:hypothetical protein
MEVTMRHLIWLALLAGSISVAQAQSMSGSMAGTYPAGPGGAPAYKAAPPDASNCGTPDDPKPCPPMPRRALKTYPGPKHPDGQG